MIDFLDPSSDANCGLFEKFPKMEPVCTRLVKAVASSDAFAGDLKDVRVFPSVGAVLFEGIVDWQEMKGSNFSLGSGYLRDMRDRGPTCRARAVSARSVEPDDSDGLKILAGLSIEIFEEFYISPVVAVNEYRVAECGFASGPVHRDFRLDSPSIILPLPTEQGAGSLPGYTRIFHDTDLLERNSAPGFLGTASLTIDEATSSSGQSCYTDIFSASGDALVICGTVFPHGGATIDSSHPGVRRTAVLGASYPINRL
jgi:hypothetical protein